MNTPIHPLAICLHCGCAICMRARRIVIVKCCCGWLRHLPSLVPSSGASQSRFERNEAMPERIANQVRQGVQP